MGFPCSSHFTPTNWSEGMLYNFIYNENEKQPKHGKEKNNIPKTKRFGAPILL